MNDRPLKLFDFKVLAEFGPGEEVMYAENFDDLKRRLKVITPFYYEGTLFYLLSDKPNRRTFSAFPEQVSAP